MDKIVQEIHAQGGTAFAMRVDVGDRAQVEALARAAVDAFGRIDTWINDAAISIYGRLDEVSEEDSQAFVRHELLGRGVRLSCRLAVPAHAAGEP